MEKSKLEPQNMADDNIALIGELFPDCITECRDEKGNLRKAVHMEKLQQKFSHVVTAGEESYDFTWVGKKAALVEANTPTNKTLRPVVEESKDWDTTENLYIEGDNLETLKLLQAGYQGAVRLIYIDPPYNTGHDFIYPDSFMMDDDAYAWGTGYFDEDGNVNYSRENNEAAGRYHSDWCSMIYARLMLARNLMADDGLILINMDEHEIANLQKICGEIFGESNDLGTIVWDKRNPKGDAMGISCQHEYILVYARSRSALTKRCRMQRPKKNAEMILKKAAQLFARIGEGNSLEEVNAEFASWIHSRKELSGGERAYNRIDGQGNVYRPVSMAWPNRKKAPDEYFVPLLHPLTGKPCPVPERGWRNPPATMKRLLEEGKILFGKDETTIPNSKYLLKDNMYEKIPSLLYYGGSDTEMLAQMHIPFDTPKVVNICKEHIRSFTGEGDIILDFFSGSATVAHAVMEANAEDHAGRRYIMVQIPETIREASEAYRQGYRNICQIGRDRIRRAGEKILAETGAEIDYGFRVFRVDESNLQEVFYSAQAYTQSMLSRLVSPVKEDRTDLDLLFGCLINWGVPLSGPYRSTRIDGCMVHDYNNGKLVACFDEKMTEAVVKAMAEKKPRRVVLRDDCFADSVAKINVMERFRCLTPETQIKVI